MANTVTKVAFASEDLTAFLAKAIDNGTIADVIQTLKVDEVVAAATEQDTNSGEILANLVDDYLIAAYPELRKVSIYLRTGTGSPESVVTAPVGTLYLRTNGSAGNAAYIKESGTGNTGWTAIGGGGGGGSAGWQDAFDSDYTAAASEGTLSSGDNDIGGDNVNAVNVTSTSHVHANGTGVTLSLISDCDWVGNTKTGRAIQFDPSEWIEDYSPDTHELQLWVHVARTGGPNEDYEKLVVGFDASGQRATGSGDAANYGFGLMDVFNTSRSTLQYFEGGNTFTSTTLETTDFQSEEVIVVETANGDQACKVSCGEYDGGWPEQSAMVRGKPKLHPGPAVLAYGQWKVAANVRAVIAIGNGGSGTTNFSAVIKRVRLRWRKYA